MRTTLKIVGGLLFAMVVIVLLFAPEERPSLDAQIAEKAIETGRTQRAADLVTAFEYNEIMADETWGGKWVAITGTVFDIGREITGKAYVMLDSDGLDGLQCVFAHGDNSAARLFKGQEITVVGKVDGKLMNVVVRDCELRY